MFDLKPNLFISDFFVYVLNKPLLHLLALKLDESLVFALSNGKTTNN